MVKHLDDCIQTGDVHNWILESRTVLIQKDARKGNAVGNYRPIACLNLLWKLLTGIVNEKSLRPFKPTEPTTRGTEMLLTKNWRNKRSTLN